MDNGSTDDTGVVVRELASGVRRLRHIVEPRLGVSLVRNRGAGEASGDLVAFLDDASVAAPHWLDALADAALCSPDAAAVAGPIGLRCAAPPPASFPRLGGWYAHLY